MTLREANIAIARPRVLVVDDDADICTMVSKSLEAVGCVVFTLDSGVKAFSLVERSLADEGVPGLDLVLSDIGMPQMSGLELLSRIRNISALLPVVLFTAYCTERTREAGLQLGAFAVLEKPVGINTLRAVVFSALGRTAQNPEQSQRDQRKLVTS